MSEHSAENDVTITVEWRVESETTEDEFGTDEEAAREWLAHCDAMPDWEPVELLCRTVTVTTTPWSVTPPRRGD